jgi:hypothetical protein
VASSGSTGQSQEVSVNSRFAFNDMRVLMQACKAGLGIALLPQLMTEQTIAQGELMRVLPNYKRASNDLGLQLVYTRCPITGRHGTREDLMPSSSTAQRPLASVTLCRQMPATRCPSITGQAPVRPSRG